ncbi:VOC family protein [Microvirga alba]|uniref:VOC family protein n=1 Tax=Microvirga alba TaxID=2791025 RepID=A0A931FRV7_9HYPH|nr:VOC family protein [Microvirga alba]MBF9234953.1 VOC family protein [Microvirga alba]
MRQFLRAGFRRSALCAIATVSLLSFHSTHLPPALAQSAPAARSGAVSIRTPDFDETIRWYQNNLGFRLIASRNLVPGRSAVLERNGSFLEVTEADHPMPPGGEVPGVTPVPVITLLVPDVDEEVERLRARGVEILQPPQDELGGSYRTAQIRDNGRHRIELREPLGSLGSFHAEGR